MDICYNLSTKTIRRGIMSKICSKCGAVLEDNATFCQLCGENQTAQVANAQPQQYYAPVKPVDDHTGIGGWIGWLLLSSFLPLFGLIIAICCTKDKSVKNWAIANLIISAVFVVLAIVLIILSFTIFLDFFAVASQPAPIYF